MRFMLNFAHCNLVRSTMSYVVFLIDDLKILSVENGDSPKLVGCSVKCFNKQFLVNSGQVSGSSHFKRLKSANQQLQIRHNYRLQ